MSMADIFLEDDTTHKEMRPSQIKSSEEDVSKVVQAFCSFQNPFVIDSKDELYCLSSGVPADKAVQEDLLHAIQKGENARNNFISKRLVDKDIDFHSPLKKMNLKTFAFSGLVKRVKSTSNKLLQVKAE
jgi:hypothetical protein